MGEEGKELGGVVSLNQKKKKGEPEKKGRKAA